MANYTEKRIINEDFERLQSENNYRQRSLLRLRSTVHSFLIPKRWRTKQNDDKEELSNQFIMKVTPVKDTETKADEGVCLLSQSPYRILKVAAKGNLAEFQKLYKADHNRLHIQDVKGLSALHHAAINGHINIAEFVVSKGGDINVQDKAGNTPLHLAVEKEQTTIIDFLIHNDADSTIANEARMAPIHLAVDSGKLKSLEWVQPSRFPYTWKLTKTLENFPALLAHSRVDVNLPGDSGATPLHYCAGKDRDECAKKLLEYGAKPCKTCNMGFYPIHLAATSAAAKTLEVLIKHVESLGYTREAVLTFTDRDNNMPLHSAVNGGNCKAVRVCLQAGAPVDAQQDDNSTPLHFACAQGSLEMITLMYELQPERFVSAMNTEDVLKMTPLHRAALFNHVDVVQFLLEKGAIIDSQDSQDRTALLIAASKGCWKTVQCLLENGSVISNKDRQNRNFLHLAIKFGGRLNEFGCHLYKNVKDLLNEKDNFGCTPLHYASREGHLIAIDDLINLGATINPKNNDKQSPLHFAARYGRYNTCKRLLESNQGSNIINETDWEGLSALHIASLNGHTKIINLLMEKGAYVTRDHEDNSPLHMAASNGYTKTIKLLLGVHANLLDCTNKQGDTALHVAAKEGKANAVELLMSLGASFTRNNAEQTFFDCGIDQKNSDVCFSIVHHERWREAMNLCSKQFGCPMSGMIQNLPDVCLAVLDQCRRPSSKDSNRGDYFLEYDFQYLQCPLAAVRKLKEEGTVVQPMYALNAMVKHNRVDCLSHTVCKTYLEMKWRAYGVWFHSINLVLYLVYLALLTALVTSPYTWVPEATKNATSGNLSGVNVSSVGGESNDEMPMQYKLSVYVLAIITCLNMLKEMLQMIQQKLKYFTDWNNVLEWILYITTALFAFPMMMNHMSKLQVEAGAIAVFLAWFNCLLFLQRFDVSGLYVVMFLEILSTLLQAFMVFSLLLVAFGLAFFLMMKTEESAAFSTPMLAILRSSMMMLELDYMASFNEPYTDGDRMTLSFGNLTIFFLVVFVLLMPILLMNLLIGLAVGDIEAVQKDATLKRLAMQVELHTDLERRMPQWLLEKVDKVQYRTYPNKCSGGIRTFWNKMTWNKGGYEENDINGRQTMYLYQELHKQKTRMKEISTNMQKQYDLLRLIVQKMEIVTEDDNKDEGLHTTSSLEKISPSPAYSFSSPFLRQNVMRSSAIVSHWKKSTQKAIEKKSGDC